MEVLMRILKPAGQWYTPCLFRLFTGLYCPGCGGTRALRALLHGEILRSFMYHPLILYGCLALPGLLARELYGYRQSRRRGTKKAFSDRIWKNALWIGIFLLAANFLIKNALLIFWGIDVPALLDSAR